MSPVLQHIPSAAVEAPEPPTIPGQFTTEQIDIIRRTVAEGTSDDEFTLFLEVCRFTGLNPIQRQIYAIVRETWNPQTRRREPRMTIQTGIDGYRLTAARTGRHAGTEDAVFGPPDDDGRPTWASVTVYRLLDNGFRAPFTATARFDEYAQRKRGDGGRPGPLVEMWDRMSYGQLAKCAESLALRKAFPAELSGVYTREEMAQATIEDAEVVGEVKSPHQASPATPSRTLKPREERDDYPGEALHGGPRPDNEAAPPEAAPPEAAPEPPPQQPDALTAADLRSAFEQHAVTIGLKSYGLAELLRTMGVARIADLSEKQLHTGMTIDADGAQGLNAQGFIDYAGRKITGAPNATMRSQKHAAAIEAAGEQFGGAILGRVRDALDQIAAGPYAGGKAPAPALSSGPAATPA